MESSYSLSRLALIGVAITTSLSAQHFVIGTQTGTPGATTYGKRTAIARGPGGQSLLAVADPLASSGGITNRGAVNFFDPLSGVATPPVRPAEIGTAQTDFFGASVATVDDLDGDGWEDFVIGAPGILNSTPPAGYIRFVSGNPMPPTSSWLPVTYVGPSGDVNFGRGLVRSKWLTTSTAFCGAAVLGRGRMHLLYANSVAINRIGSIVTTTPTTVPPGDLDIVNLGRIDSDDFEEYAFGNGTGVTVINGASVTVMATITNPAPSFGQSMAQVGDVTGNGRNDLLIGAPASGNGQAFLYEGGTWNLQQTWTGTVVGGQFGSSLSSGDFDGDGVVDYLIGAPGTAGGVAGSATLISGATNLPYFTSGAPVGTNGNLFAARVQGLGDLDGNGFEDYLLSAPAMAPAAASTLVCSGGPLATVSTIGTGCACSANLPPRLLVPLGQRPQLGGTIQLTLIDNSSPNSPAILALGPAATLPPCFYLNPISITPGFALAGGVLTTTPLPVGTSTALMGSTIRAQFAVAAQCGTAYSNALEFRVGL